MGNKKSETSTSSAQNFHAADVGVFAVCELTAIPLCHAGWDAVVSGDYWSRGALAIVAGLILGLFGISFPWLKHKISASASELIQRRASRWWPVAFVLAFAYLVGPSMFRRAGLNHDAQMGNVIWNFEQTARGLGYFLTLQRVNGAEVRFINFGAHGKNTSNNPISEFSGYLQSDLTNARLPIYLLAQNAESVTGLLACFANPWIPTRPDETFSIPPLADFEITTFDKAFIEAGKDGMPISNFWNNFGPFTLVLEYNGIGYRRHFSREEIQRQIDMFEKSLNPKSSPFVLRRPDATPVALPPLEPLVLTSPSPPPPLTIPKAPAPPLATPVPPGALRWLDTARTTE
jgi:hypothetical protein